MDHFIDNTKNRIKDWMDRAEKKGVSHTNAMLTVATAVINIVFTGTIACMFFAYADYINFFIFAGAVFGNLFLLWNTGDLDRLQFRFNVLVICTSISAIYATIFVNRSSGFMNALYGVLLITLLNSGVSLRVKEFFSVFSVAVVGFSMFFAGFIDIRVGKPVSPEFAERLLTVNEIYLICIISGVCLLYARLTVESEHSLLKFNSRLSAQAETDPLTGLLNRRGLLEKLNTEIEEYSGGSTQLSIAMGDIDFFKTVNDTYGHDAGDYVLKEIAKIMQDISGDDNLVCRWGGEEFLLVFKYANGDDAFTLVEKIRNRIHNTVFAFEGDEIRVNMTFGLEEYYYLDNIDQTIALADEKLYQGKQNGRNQTVY